MLLTGPRPNSDNVLGGYLDQAHTACGASETTSSQDLADDCLYAIQAVADSLEDAGITPQWSDEDPEVGSTEEILENLRAKLDQQDKHGMGLDDWLLNQIYRKVLTYRSLTNRDDPIDHSTGAGIQP